MKIRFLLGLIFILLLSGTASAVELLAIEPVNETYGPDSFVLLSATLFNFFDESKTFTVQETLESPETAPLPVLQIITLEPGLSRTFASNSFTVSETAPSGEYVYTIEVSEGNETFDSKSVSFFVLGTLNEFLGMDIEILDQTCANPKSVFILADKTACINALVTDTASLEGEIIYPNGNKILLSFSKTFAKVSIDRAGEYFVKISASQEGYKSRTVEKSFHVLGKDVETEDFFATLPEEKSYWLYWLIGTIALIVITVIITTIILIIRKRKQPPQPPQQSYPQQQYQPSQYQQQEYYKK